jgi:hypothetical protein
MLSLHQHNVSQLQYIQQLLIHILIKPALIRARITSAALLIDYLTFLRRFQLLFLVAYLLLELVSRKKNQLLNLSLRLKHVKQDSLHRHF